MSIAEFLAAPSRSGRGSLGGPSGRSWFASVRAWNSASQRSRRGRRPPHLVDDGLPEVGRLVDEPDRVAASKPHRIARRGRELAVDDEGRAGIGADDVDRRACPPSRRPVGRRGCGRRAASARRPRIRDARSPAGARVVGVPGRGGDDHAVPESVGPGRSPKSTRSSIIRNGSPAVMTPSLSRVHPSSGAMLGWFLRRSLPSGPDLDEAAGAADVVAGAILGHLGKLFGGDPAGIPGRSRGDGPIDPHLEHHSFDDRGVSRRVGRRRRQGRPRRTPRGTHAPRSPPPTEGPSGRVVRLARMVPSLRARPRRRTSPASNGGRSWSGWQRIVPAMGAAASTGPRISLTPPRSGSATTRTVVVVRRHDALGESHERCLELTCPAASPPRGSPGRSGGWGSRSPACARDRGRCRSASLLGLGDVDRGDALDALQELRLVTRSSTSTWTTRPVPATMISATVPLKRSWPFRRSPPRCRAPPARKDVRADDDGLAHPPQPFRSSRIQRARGRGPRRARPSGAPWGRARGRPRVAAACLDG